MAAQTAADELKSDSDDLLPDDELMDEEQETLDTEPTMEKFPELLHEMMTRIPPLPSALSRGGSLAKLPYSTCRTPVHQTSNADLGNQRCHRVPRGWSLQDLKRRPSQFQHDSSALA